MDEKTNRLLHDLQHKINGAIFALTISPLPDAKQSALELLREADAMIDTFANGEEKGGE